MLPRRLTHTPSFRQPSDECGLVPQVYHPQPYPSYPLLCSPTLIPITYELQTCCKQTISSRTDTHTNHSPPPSTALTSPPPSPPPHPPPPLSQEGLLPAHCAESLKGKPLQDRLRDHSLHSRLEVCYFESGKWMPYDATAAKAVGYEMGGGSTHCALATMSGSTYIVDFKEPLQVGWEGGRVGGG